MAKFSWSPEQQLAINEENKNIIVSAGAGSGKTAVLSERVLRKILGGVHVNELLVLTFTNAAAQEMKDRIRSKIRKTEGLEKEAELVDGAYITTFDSFSLSMVKKYHTRLNITNKIKITDEVIIDLQKKKILEEIMEEYYENPTKEFEKLIENFCLKDDKELTDYLLNIYKKIELKYDKTSYIENYFDEEYTEEKINSYIKEYLDLIFQNIEDIRKLLIELNDYFDGEYMVLIEDTLKDLLEAKDYNEIIHGLAFKELPRLKPKSDEEGKKIKETISNIVKEIRQYASYESVDSMKEEIYSTKENAEVLISILKEFDKRLEEYKKETESYNFNDIARMAIKVVKENEDIRKELSESFNEILVDEYQDTSDTQETFINLIAHNNVYMVGDIKQSIYRFRNANPYIFKNKYDSYRDTDAGMKIDLLQNFRSRREVLEDINLLFDLFMDDTIGGADYKASHRMVFGNKAYETEGKTPQNYHMKLLTYEYDRKNKITRDEEEAFIIGNDIKEKITNHYQVFDKDEKVLRDIEYKDFVILLDRSKNFDLYKNILEYLGIPLTILKEESLRKDQDVFVLKNLLRFLICIKKKNYGQDFIYSYTSLSRSYLRKTDDQEIYEKSKKNEIFSSELFQIGKELVENIDIMSPSDFLYSVLDRLEYDYHLLTIGNIKAFRVRVEYFYNLMNSFEELGNTIYDFADYLDSIFEENFDLKFNVNGSTTNSCKIMTIHKSKGLEFPICYFAGFQDHFNTNELKEKILFDNRYGIILPKVDHYYKDTILKTLLKSNIKKEEISERIRLLYVAVTRAKEEMIFVTPKMEEERFVDDIVPNYIRRKYGSFLDIMKSIYSNLLPYEVPAKSIATKDYLENRSNKKNPEKLEKDEIKVEDFVIENKELEEKHFSKEMFHLITREEKEKLDFGTKIHEVLETIDFKNPNYEIYHLPKNIEEKIRAFIQSDKIQLNLENSFYKEYEFINTEKEEVSHGIIDLLIEQDNKMIIIDYKLKNMEDDAYQKQLNGYRKVIEERTGKETECYLYSIMDGEFRSVER